MTTPKDVADRLRGHTIAILDLLGKRNVDPADALVAVTYVYCFIFRLRPSATKEEAQREMVGAIDEVWAALGPVQAGVNEKGEN